MKPSFLKLSFIAGILIISVLIMSLDNLSPIELGRNLGLANPPGDVPSQSAARMQSRAADAYGRLPMYFEPNQGQAEPSVKFLSHGGGFTLQLRTNEAVLAPSDKSRGRELVSSKGMNLTRTFHLAGSDLPSLDVRGRGADDLYVRKLRSNPPQPIPPETGKLLRMRLVGGSPAAKFEALDPLPGKVNYYIGNDPSRWHAGIPTFAKVRYHGAYPGVDLVYYGKQGEIEYDFEVAPGANPAVINLAIAVENSAPGATRSGGKRARLAPEATTASYPLRIDSQGNLVHRTNSSL